MPFYFYFFLVEFLFSLLLKYIFRALKEMLFGKRLKRLFGGYWWSVPNFMPSCKVCRSLDCGDTIGKYDILISVDSEVDMLP